jgi:transposase-like protein
MSFPRCPWRGLCTPNVIERCFVEARRRTRPIACFVDPESVVDDNLAAAGSSSRRAESAAAEKDQASGAWRHR